MKKFWDSKDGASAKKRIGISVKNRAIKIKQEKINNIYYGRCPICNKIIERCTIKTCGDKKCVAKNRNNSIRLNKEKKRIKEMERILQLVDNLKEKNYYYKGKRVKRVEFLKDLKANKDFRTIMLTFKVKTMDELLQLLFKEKEKNA